MIIWLYIMRIISYYALKEELAMNLMDRIEAGVKWDGDAGR